MMRVGMEMMRRITNRIGSWRCLSCSFFGFIAGFLYLSFYCVSIRVSDRWQQTSRNVNVKIFLSSRFRVWSPFIRCPQSLCSSPSRDCITLLEFTRHIDKLPSSSTE
jgi:hypothetical protein